MADKAISELLSAEQITATDMFVLEQNGTAKKLTGQVLLNWLTAAADGHGGIQSWIPLKTEGLVKTFRVTLADQTYIDIDVVDGRGVEDVRKIKTEGLVDTYQIVYNDGPPGTFQVVNGAKGDKGDNAGIWVRYASQKPTAESHSFGELPDAWVGIASGHLSSAPTDWQAYTWYQWKGEKGETGEPATIVSAEITYQASDSGTIIPSGSWGASVPPVTPGRYLWTRQVLQFNSGDPITSYSVSRFGIDGSGAVSAVAGVAPDENGNVPLDAASVKALALAGGTMEGNINMSGKKLRGLNAPVENDEPATKGYADNLKPDLTGYATEKFVTNTIAEKTVNNFTTTEAGFVADARALKILNDSKLDRELVWENSNLASEFGEIDIPLNCDDCTHVLVVMRLSTTSSSSCSFICEKNETTWCAVAVYNPQVRPVSIDDSGIHFGYGRYYGTFGNAASTKDNARMIPYRVYVFKGGN